MRIQTAPGRAERLLVLGLTGSGKTVLTRELAKPLRSVVVIDTKMAGDWLCMQDLGYVVSREPAAIRRHEKVVIQVPQTALDDRAGWQKEGRPGYLWTEVLRSIAWRTRPGPDGRPCGSTVEIHDEAMQTLPAHGAHPEARQHATQGRALGLSVWLQTQAPLHIDTVMMAMSEHCIAFAMHNPRYRAELEARRGIACDVLDQLSDSQPAAHVGGQFGWHHQGTREWVVHEPVSPTLALQQ